MFEIILIVKQNLCNVLTEKRASYDYNKKCKHVYANNTYRTNIYKKLSTCIGKYFIIKYRLT